MARFGSWRAARALWRGAAVLATAALAGCGGMNDEAARAALRAADVADINNVMSLHSWYHAAMQNGVEVEKIWSKRDDIVIARNTGYWKGANVRKYYGEKVGEPFTTGAFVWHPVTTGVIEVAGDRQTAKGVWYTPGAGGHASAGGRKSIDWMWEKYGVDFIREDGHWKVWHMKVYTDWSGDANVNFQKGGMGAPPPGAAGPGGPPGAPPPSAGKGPPVGPPPAGAATPGAAPRMSAAAKQDVEGKLMQGGPPPGAQMPASLSAAEDVVYQSGYKEWSGTAAPKLQPRPPEPYRTFSETWSYVDENE